MTCAKGEPISTTTERRFTRSASGFPTRRSRMRILRWSRPSSRPLARPLSLSTSPIQDRAPGTRSCNCTRTTPLPACLGRSKHCAAFAVFTWNRASRNRSPSPSRPRISPSGTSPLHAWRVEDGLFDIAVGSSSADIRAQGSLSVASPGDASVPPHPTVP
jgi:hypothetical protein